MLDIIIIKKEFKIVEKTLSYLFIQSNKKALFEIVRPTD